MLTRVSEEEDGLSSREEDGLEVRSVMKGLLETPETV